MTGPARATACAFILAAFALASGADAMAEPGSAAVPRAASATGLDPAQAGTGLDAALAIDMTSAPQRTAPPPRTAAPKQGGMLPEAHDSLPDVPMGLLVLLAALGMMALTMRRRPG